MLFVHPQPGRKLFGFVQRRIFSAQRQICSPILEAENIGCGCLCTVLPNGGQNKKTVGARMLSAADRFFVL